MQAAGAGADGKTEQKMDQVSLRFEMLLQLSLHRLLLRHTSSDPVTSLCFAAKLKKSFFVEADEQLSVGRIYVYIITQLREEFTRSS